MQNIRNLATLPLAQWELVQYLLALVTLGLIAAAGFRGWGAYKKFRKKQEDAKNPQAAEGGDAPGGPDEDNASAGDAAASADAPAGQPALARPASRYDDDDLAYLDELDAEEDARLEAERAARAVREDSVEAGVNPGEGERTSES